MPTKTTVIPPPTITCPIAPSAVTSSSGQSAVVSYGAAAVTGGTAPVSTTCTPSSGSTFNLGSTVVACTATDAVRRTAGCSFAVNVTLPSPRLGVATILAFGDSITEGEVPVAGEFGAHPQFVEREQAYPAQLTTLLGQRYSAQGSSRLDAICGDDPPSTAASGIVVINAGCLGERAQDFATLARLDDKLVTYHPDVVLLLEGVNDLSSLGSIPATVRGVQTLISAVRSRGTRVIVGTLLPEIAGDVNGGSWAFVVPFNNQLVPVATNAGALVVDLYSDIATDVTDWISPFDGLHPTEAGYQETARVFFNSIKNAFELPQSSIPAATTGRVPPHMAFRSGSRR